MSIQTMYISATALEAQTTSIDNTANNVANVNTTGFKSSRVEFVDLLYQTNRVGGTLSASGIQYPVGIQTGLGVRVTAISTDFAQGNVEQTGRDLDVAINGNGFFRITMPDGTLRYTRDGSFKITATGKLVTSEGFSVTPAITVPSGSLSVTISPDGVVTVEPAAAPGTFVQVGQLQLSRFINPDGLAKDGDNLYAETAASGPPITGTPGTNALGTTLQGFLESSNVDVVRELVELLTAQRAFEVAARVLRTGSEMLQTANEIFRL